MRKFFNLQRKKSRARKDHNHEEYKRLKREIRTKVRRDKLNWLKQECSQITEANIARNSKKLFDQIKKLKPSCGNIKSQSLNDKSGNLLNETKEVLKRSSRGGTNMAHASFRKMSKTQSHPLSLLTRTQSQSLSWMKLGQPSNS